MRSLTLRTEFVRQAGRRRTQLTLGLLGLLPVLLMAALELGGRPSDSAADQFAQLARLATSSGTDFAFFALFVASGFLLVVAVALFCGDTVASEASWGSLRYLLAAPVPRARLLGVKLVAALVWSVATAALLLTVALVVGTARYGWHPLSLPAGGQLPAGVGLVRLLGVVAYVLVSLLSIGALAFLLSVCTDAPLGAVGGAVLITILSNILDQISALGDLRAGLPTHYSVAFLGLLSETAQTGSMVRGAFVSIAYAAVLLALAWWRFLRKDVTS
ncbi:ABC-2 type transport system permease protein [Motilibacter rhizosphaerae]|uniref:ABC-2 type transport system permease protein n=1 Tax=Motilibacter rhizosphaerae TaxID=598652 RepID=A0A4Q7NUW9_9ACTN|nr:ABC transporter permease [Motilibacter rhizosphaerae]RZS91026.1 ABC-2 type transport system permease protein [Motilibacter rhizosphaerae]